MNTNDKKTVEKIRGEYTPAEKTKLDELRALDRKVKRPAATFAYIFGTVGALVLGTGMCLAMKVIGGTPILTAAGIVIGIIGFAGVGINYPIYKKMLENGKKKYAFEIVELAKEISEGK